jgi:hypothetical protein
MTKRISPLARLTIGQQQEIYQLFADQISNHAIADKLQEWGVSLTVSEVGIERTVWRSGLVHYQEAVEAVTQHRAAYPDSCEQPIVAVAAEIMAATSLLLAKRLHGRVALMLDHDDDDEQMVLAIEMLNRLAEANQKIARSRGMVAAFSIELPQKQPKQIEAKAGITGELIGEIEQLLRLMPNN